MRDPAESFTQAVHHHRLGRVKEAESLYREVLASEPGHCDAWNNLGIALKMQGDVDGAVGAFRQALALDPKRAQTWAFLGHLLKDCGQLDEAIEAYRRGLAIQADPRIGSSLLLAMQSHSLYSPRDLFGEHRRWNQLFAEPLRKEIHPHENERGPNRRLRVGYVASSLGNHPLGRFLLPLLQYNDRERFEIFCYCDTCVDDAVAQSLKNHTDTWRPTLGISDERLAQLIEEDRIDILVDLVMHAAGSRLLAFARKPAPVQITYLAYCGTTGLSTIDYRLSDLYLDPPGSDGSVYSEKTVRLRSYWCYQPPAEAPPVGEFPCAKAGFITFGCLSSFAKVTPDILKLWCTVLRQTPRSKLILHAHEGTHRDRVRRLFEAEGVTSDRLTFVGYRPIQEYFEQYNWIDISLDTTPWSGGTTTCDALWMGVPVISLAGETALSRAGLSILSNIGAPELVARDMDQYVQIAHSLSGDLSRLVDLRRTFRPRMQSSPLMNATQFAHDIEVAYRAIWQAWCIAPVPNDEE